MEQNTDRMGFALIALSIVAIVLIIMNTIFGPTVKSYFQGLQKWSDNVMNQLNPPQQYIHTAYAWSSDGSDRFTTTKPNYNLLNNSRLDFDALPSNVNNGLGTDVSSRVVVSDLMGSAYGRSYTPKGDGNIHDSQTGLRMSSVIGSTSIGDKITLSWWIKNTSGRDLSFVRQVGFRYGSKTEPENDSKGWYYYNATDKYMIKADGQWHYGSITTVVPPATIASDRTGDYLKSVVGYAYTSLGVGPSLKTDTFIVAQPKLEKGPTATPQMPSQSEATSADEPTYIGTYTDTNEQGSQDPTKYTWTKTN